jgi:multidrug efflux pump subunit AcrB/outer membrane protein TolC
MLASSFPQFRLTLSISLLLTVLGIVAFFVIPKEEDPHLRNRWGLVTVVFPGARPERIEDWVLNPLENDLKSVPTIKKMETVIRPQYAAINIELKDGVTEIEEAWNEVQEKLNLLQPKLPSGVTELSLDRRVVDLEAILVSVSSKDLAQLSKEGLRLRRALLSVRETKEVVVHGDPEMGIAVKVNSQRLAARGLTVPQLISQLQSSNQAIPAGIQQSGAQNILVQSPSVLTTVEEVRAMPLLYPRLTAAPLGDVAEVSWLNADFPKEVVRSNGERVMVLGVVPNHPVDVVRWGEEMRAFLKNYPVVAGVKIEEISYQPARTQERIAELGESLLVGILSVIAVLGLWMGWRIGLVVAVSVPVISVIGFGFYFLGGGVLHQISLAALLLSLGQFIDNVTVVAESVQRKIDEGADPSQASAEASRHYRWPMVFATGTAIASFLPMLASEGATAEFTFAIPLIAIITLLVSWFFALQATPVLTAVLLKPSPRKTKSTQPQWFTWAADRILRYPKAVVLSTLALLLASMLGMGLVKKEFFPSADRNEFVMRIEMPAGSSLRETDRVTQQLEKILAGDTRVAQVSAYVGSTTPTFYYSILPDRRVSDLAELYIRTHSGRDNVAVALHAEKGMQSLLPKGARLLTKQLMQGPPVRAAIELELQGHDLPEMSAALGRVLSKAQTLSGVQSVRTDAPRFLPMLSFALDESRFLENGSDRNMFALTLLSWSQGADATYFYQEGERFPIRVSLDERSVEKLTVLPTLNRDLKVTDVTKQTPALSATSIQHVNGVRTVRLLSDLAPGFGFNDVEPQLYAWLAEEAKTGGWVVSRGGQVAESQTANLSILRALPIGVLLLIVCLLYEFRSFRKLLLVMFGVATVGAGVVPGLLIGRQPFGFMSLLGVLALVGIVVNNAILIIEAIEEARGQGGDIPTAIRRALELRTRPILMTTLMTLLGLLPLAFEDSTLWPPMAWAMMSGLVVSTLLSLFFLPSAYQLLFEGKMKSPFSFSVGTTVGAILLYVSGSLGVWGVPIAEARVYSVEELNGALSEADNEVALEMRRQASVKRADAVWKESFMPKLRTQFDRTMNDRDLFITNPLGRSNYGRDSYWVGGVELEQPLLMPARMFYAEPAAKSKARSEELQLQRQRDQQRLEVLKWALAYQELAHHLRLLEQLRSNLQSQGREVRRLVSRGRSAPSDEMKVEVELENLQREMESMRIEQENLQSLLKTRVPDLESVKITELKNLHDHLKAPLSQQRGPVRADLGSLREAIRAFDGEKKAQLAIGLPELRLFGRYQYTNQGFIEQTDWYALGLQLRWELWDGGARFDRAGAAVKERLALESEERLLTSQIQTEQLFIEKQFVRFREDAEVYERTARKTKDILNKEREAYALGKVSLNQVLDAERLWIDQQRNFVKALFGLWRTRLEKKLAHGEGWQEATDSSVSS